MVGGRLREWLWGWAGLVAALLSIGAAAGAAPEPAGQVRITYIAHASFVIESPKGTRLLIDPYADRVWLGYDFPKGLTYDAVVITHPHYDHDGGEFRGLPVPWPKGTPVFRDPGTFTFGDIRLTGLKGKHADPYGKEFGQKNVIWTIETGGLRIVHWGDNGPLTPALAQHLKNIDILMLPADGKRHILSDEATAAILARLRPRILIPMHYRLPDLEPGPDTPSGLGEIEPWLADWHSLPLRRLRGNRWPVSKADLPSRSARPQVILFHNAPEVSRP